MLRRIGLLAALLFAAAGGAQAQAFNPNDLPLTRIARPDGTPVDPTGGSGGGGGSTGSVTAAGTNGTTAQAVQGITGGIPQNSFPGQYNATLPTFSNAAPGYLSVDVNGRLILAPSSSVSVSNFPATQNVAGTVTIGNPYSTTTTGALEPPTAASGKKVSTPTAIAANTNTTIAAANANRIAVGIQCGSGGVVVSETGATLTSATFGATGQTIYVPSGNQPFWFPGVATRTAITAYTATAQTCVVTEDLR